MDNNRNFYISFDESEEKNRGFLETENLKFYAKVKG